MVVDTTPYKVEGSYLADFVYLYVPNACLEKVNCPFHIFFHGLGQSAVQDEYGTDVLRGTGLLEYAANPDLPFIVMAPQANDSSEAYGGYPYWRSAW